jgi:hypothetical protein
VVVEIPIGYGQLSFKWALTGDPQPMISTMGFGVRNNPTPSQQLLNDAAGQLESSFRARLGFATAASIIAGWTYHGADFLLRPDAGDAIAGHVGPSVTGTATGETLPVNTAILVKKRTALGGRKHRGRMYIPMARVTENTVSKLGVIDSTEHTSLQTAFNNWLADNQAVDGAEMVILHSDETLVPTPINALQVDNTVASQRRRLRR